MRRACGRARADAGFTLVELVVTMALMLVVLTAVSATFASGTHSETNVSKRIQSESDARSALTKMRDDLHCAFDVGSLTQNSGGGFTFSVTEFYNTCAAVDQNPGSGSKVFLAWCTIPSPSNPNVFDLYRKNTTCDNAGTRIARNIVAPAAGWSSTANSIATGAGGTGTPSSWAGNIWPQSPTCQLGYLKTQAIDMAVNPDYANNPTGSYELKDQIALRNSTRCGGAGSGSLATPALTVSAPTTSPRLTPITPSATVSGSSNETSPITFFYWIQPSAPTDCTTGGTTVGTASTNGDGNYPSSLSYTPTTAGDHVWWYASLPADSNNIAMTSTCGASMPMTNVTQLVVSPTLSISVPSTASTGVLIPATSIGATLSGSSGATTGAITFYVATSSSSPCPGAMTSFGTANPTADGTWNPSAGYTPGASGTLWWYAKFAGDALDNPAGTTCAPVASTTVKTGQTISFTSTAPTAAAVGGSTYTATATATSGLSVTFSSATTSVCTTSGAVVTFVAEGTCTINANQAGNGTYNAAPQVQQTFTVYSLLPSSILISNASGTLHKPDAPDTIAITFNHGIQLSSVCSSWSSSAQTVTGITVTMNAGNGSNKNDLSFSSGTVGATACSGGVKIGTFASSAALYNTSSSTKTWTTSTMAWNAGTNTLTITLGGSPSGLSTAASNSTYTYTPNAAISLATNNAVKASGTAASTANHF